MYKSPIDRSSPWLVIVNPAAASGRVAHHWDRWQARLQRLLPAAHFLSTRPLGGLVAAIKQAQTEGLGGVLAVGGDGTAHLVVNALLEVQVATGRTILFALLPLGTGNDWIKTHRIPRRWRTWKAMFLRGQVSWQNVGFLQYRTLAGEPEQRYFINVAGLAYDAFVVREVAQQAGRASGKWLYLWATLRCLFRYTPQRVQLTWSTDQVTASCYTINLGIGRYSGGGMQLVPHADPQGNALALTYVEQLDRWRVLLNSWRFYRGWIAGLREAHLHSLATLQIENIDTPPVLLEADGEFLGQTPVTVSFVAQGLWFVGSGE